MAIIKYDPFRGFESVTKRMNNFLSTFEPSYGIEYGAFTPKVDISEDENHLYIHAELPGLAKDDIKITISNDEVLTIKGIKSKKVESSDNSEGKTYHRIERSYGEFARSFVLPDNINKEIVSAKFEDGVLYITLEKTELENPKDIEIGVN